MDDHTIAHLNNLNRTFYQQVAQDFNTSRNYFWQGWHMAIPYLTQALDASNAPQTKDTPHSRSILDVGCGNGRFGVFLHQCVLNTLSSSPALRYVGIDSNDELLSKAKENTSHTELLSSYSQIDIIEHLQHGEHDPVLQETFDIVAIHGVLHHIPSYELRAQVMEWVISRVKPSGIAFISFWHQLSPRLLLRAVSPKKFGIDPTLLEKGDYILDWRRNTQGYRYCHLTTMQEARSLIPAHTDILKTYLADGQSNAENLYFILQRP